MTAQTTIINLENRLLKDPDPNHFNASPSHDAEAQDGLDLALGSLSLSPATGLTGEEKEEFKEDVPDEAARWAAIRDSLSMREAYSDREDDVAIWSSMGRPDIIYRVCRDINQDIISVWACYPDIRDLFPENHTFVRSPTPSELERKKWAIVDFPGRGKGLQATCNIARGEIIIRETPVLITTTFMCFSGGKGGSEASLRVLQEGISRKGLDYLQPVDKARVLELSNCMGDRYPFHGIRATNELACTFYMPGAKLRRHGGICPVICRVNHRFVSLLQRNQHRLTMPLNRLC